MEKKMENKMETREYIGVSWAYIGIIIEIQILRPLKEGGLLIMGLH